MNCGETVFTAADGLFYDNSDGACDTSRKVEVDPRSRLYV
ncbi:hypothetical protein HMPREF0308_0908 [Corynebacterium striatum ATCC 6940]|nr:hypothetical protein HMPREF0308_0908 [Corynebacterium striatum ATCC 6940]